jgi:hypothetical protein
MSFGNVFLAVVIAFALVLFAFLINRERPRVETEQPTAELSAPRESAPNVTPARNTPLFMNMK